MTGRALRQVRRRFGETQVQFARRVGLSSNHLAKVERGEIGVSETLAILVRLLDRQHKEKTR